MIWKITQKNGHEMVTSVRSLGPVKEAQSWVYTYVKCKPRKQFSTILLGPHDPRKREPGWMHNLKMAIKTALRAFGLAMVIRGITGNWDCWRHAVSCHRAWLILHPESQLNSSPSETEGNDPYGHLKVCLLSPFQQWLGSAEWSTDTAYI